VTHGDDEPVADEGQDLAEDDVFLLGEPAGGLEDEEERLTVDLELGPLVSLDRVLDGEFMELELASNRLEFGLVRLEEADPDECIGCAAGLERVVEGQLAGAPYPVLVDRAVDDHGPSIAQSG
jgi:hypothetical protein